MYLLEKPIECVSKLSNACVGTFIPRQTSIQTGIVWSHLCVCERVCHYTQVLDTTRQFLCVFQTFVLFIRIALTGDIYDSSTFAHCFTNALTRCLRRRGFGHARDPSHESPYVVRLCVRTSTNGTYLQKCQLLRLTSKRNLAKTETYSVFFCLLQVCE